MSINLSKDKAYITWLEELKKKIQSSQIKAAIKVNIELLNLYWQLGEEITLKQQKSNWGDAIIDQLSKDLTTAFPGMKGFSKRNLFYIRQWYLFYTQGQTKVPQLVAQFDGGNESSYATGSSPYFDEDRLIPTLYFYLIKLR